MVALHERYATCGGRSPKRGGRSQPGISFRDLVPFDGGTQAAFGHITEAVRDVYYFSRSNTEWRMDLESTASMRLPVGYRLVAVASDVWVLLAPGGVRVARYLGGLDRWRVELDAREHQERDG